MTCNRCTHGTCRKFGYYGTLTRWRNRGAFALLDAGRRFFATLRFLPVIQFFQNHFRCLFPGVSSRRCHAEIGRIVKTIVVCSSFRNASTFPGESSM